MKKILFVGNANSFFDLSIGEANKESKPQLEN
jgi:hypothetical protein